MTPPREAHGVPPGDQTPRLQFSTRWLLLVVAACAVVISVAEALGPWWTLLLVWLAVMVALHVLGNAWGTRVRDGRPPGRLAAERPAFADSARLTPPEATASHLGLRRRTGWSTTAWTAAGAALGGVWGAWFFQRLNLPNMHLHGIIVAALSAAVLGGLVAFLAAGFLDVGWRAWNEAAGVDARRRSIRGRRSFWSRVVGRR